MINKMKSATTSDGLNSPTAASGGRTTLETQFSLAERALNPRRRQLVRAILDNPGETFFLSSREMAKRYGVDAATIVRTVQALGYERFADFASDLRGHFIARITPYSVMKATARSKQSLTDHVRDSLDRDAENLHVLKSTLNTDQVIKLARMIQRSGRILVVGIDLAGSLAAFLAYGLMPLGFNTEAPSGSTGTLHHKVRGLTSKDLLIGISFGRCLRQTVEAMQMALARGVPTFGITDGDTTPVAKYADAYLCASIASPAVSGSYVAPLALMNTILVTCSLIQSKRSLALLRHTEEEYASGSRWYQEPVQPPLRKKP